MYLWLQSMKFKSLYCHSVTQSCPTLCNAMDCSMAGFSVLHDLREFTQTHVHCVGDAIQPPQLLLSPSPPVLNLSQHQGLFQWHGSSHQFIITRLRHIFINKIGTIIINTFLPIRNKFVCSCSVKKSVLWGLTNFWKTFSANCWLWKDFPCKKLSRRLEEVVVSWQRAGEYGGWSKTL